MSRTVEAMSDEEIRRLTVRGRKLQSLRAKLKAASRPADREAVLDEIVDHLASGGRA